MREIFVLLILVHSSACFFDPITIGAAVGIGSLWWKYDAVKEYTYCQFSECCTDNYIPADVAALERALKNNLFGQHIVIQQIIPALKSHLRNGDKSKKPLVISFHGTPGTGKNYVVDFIAKTLYKNGLDSSFVQKFSGRADFPLESQSARYQEIIVTKVKDTVARCTRSLFIFDEVDKMPSGVFESLTSLLDYHLHHGGISYRNAIFVFLSNTAGLEIAEHLGSLMKQGVWRGNTSIQDFEKILEMAAYNLEGGLKKSSVIGSHLIDHFIPFLPLEKQHVEECIKAEYMRLGVFSPKPQSIKYIVDNFVTFDKSTGLFATTGCKRLSKKVEVYVYG